MNLLSIISNIIAQAIAFFIKDAKRKEEIQRDIKKELDQYEREARTSAEIRESAKDTRKRLIDKLRGIK